MISSKAEHPNCMYMWMNHIISPETNPAATQYFGEAPANAKSCDLHDAAITARRSTPATRSTSTRSTYWTTPVAECGDDRGAVCKDYPEWVQAWTRSRARHDGDARRAMSATPETPTRAPGGAVASAAASRAPCTASLDAARPTAGRSARLAGDRVSGLARCPADRRVLAPRHVHGRHRQGLLARQLPHPLGRRRVPRDHAAHRGDRRARDGGRCRARLPDRVLHGEGRGPARAGCCSSRS